MAWSTLDLQALFALWKMCAHLALSLRGWSSSGGKDRLRVGVWDVLECIGEETLLPRFESHPCDLT